MKLFIQKTSQPGSILSDAEIRDIKELLLGYDREPLNEYEIEEERESEVPDASAEDEAGLENALVHETEEEYIIEIPAAGFQKEDFMVEVSQDGILAISALAEVQSYERNGTMRPAIVEESEMSHAFQLPDDANIDEIEARYEGGVLTIFISKL